MNLSRNLLPAVGLMAAVAGTSVAAADGRKADFAMEIDNLNYEFVDGLNKYHHARRFVSRNGVGVTLDKGKVCYVEQDKCISAVVSYRIDGGKSLTQPRHLVSTTLDNETVTVEYWGEDDNGNDIAVKKVFRLNRDQVTIEQGVPAE